MIKTRWTWLAVVASWLVTVGAVANDAVLYWLNGDQLPGSLVRADRELVIWRSPLFTDPLQIERSALAAVQLRPVKTKATDAPANSSAYRVWMHNGDVLAGELLSITKDQVQLSDARFGTYTVPRNKVLRLQRVTGRGVIYAGPRGLEGWQEVDPMTNRNGRARVIRALNAPAPVASAPKRAVWTANPDGTLTTLKPDASLFLPVELTKRFEVEMELTSTKRCSFAMVVGTDTRSGLRVETWIDVLVAAAGANFTELDSVPWTAQEAHFHCFVDLTASKLSVYSAGGKHLGDLQVPTLRDPAKGLTFLSRENDLTIRRLRISEWDGKAPRIVATDKTRVQLADGTVHYGVIERYPSQPDHLQLRDNDTSLELPIADVESIVMIANESLSLNERGEASVSWDDGCFVSGELDAVNDGQARMLTKYGTEPLVCQLADAMRLGFLRQVPPPAATNQGAAPDRLTLSAGEMRGNLVVDGQADAPIRWQPLGSRNASTWQAGGDAIVHRSSGVQHFSEDAQWLARYPDVLYLINNDVLPCQVSGVNDGTVLVASPFCERQSFSKDEVRAVELGTAGRSYQSGFGAEAWSGSAKVEGDAKDKLVFRNSSNFGHPSILTGDTVRFRLSWPQQAYGNLTVRMFGSGRAGEVGGTAITFNMMQSQLQVHNRPQQQGRVVFGFAGSDGNDVVHVVDTSAEVQIQTRSGQLVVSVNGRQLKSFPVSEGGVQSRALSLQATMTNMGQVVINGRVQSRANNAIEITQFEVDNLPGASIHEFIEEESRQAVLTIPRFRRDSPPTHVLLAPNGDLLRGRLVGLDERQVRFESRLETMRLERSRVAAIVWLQTPKPPAAPADSATGQSAAGERKSAATTNSTDSANSSPPSAANVESGSRSAEVQVQLAEGFSLTLTPERLDNGRIVGHSSMLGACTFPAAAIRALKVGNPQGWLPFMAYDQWVAQFAKEPDWDIPQSDGGSSAGAAMIGKVADDFQLPMLDGTTFRLSEHKDKIVVLDFWATWCGPCVRALPEYVAATSHFDASQVIFVAVNLRESSDQVRGFLARQNLSPRVALDRSGEVAEKFQVSGIPHTVILGKDNVVHNVHVGYQAGGGEAMQITLQELLK